MGDFGLLVARYNASLPTLADGQYHNLQVDSSGRLLVQADVSVVIDFLGLNGASDSSNILIIGTEDGTSGGTAHAIRVDTGGQVIVSDGGASLTVDAVDLDIRDLVFATDKVDVSGSEVSLDAATLAALESITVQNGPGAAAVNIQDGGNSITVDATDLDIRDLTHVSDSVKVGDGTDFLAVNADGSLNITDNGGSLTVDATDLDIRDLSASQDNVAISDGTDTLEINADGSINVQATAVYEGTESYNATDDLAAAADGLVTITASGTPFITAVSIAVPAGQVLHIYGMDWTCDQNAQARLISDDGTDIIVYKQSLNSSAQPDQFKYFGEAGRIEIAGSATMNVRIQIKKRTQAGGDGLGHASIHARLVS